MPLHIRTANKAHLNLLERASSTFSSPFGSPRSSVLSFGKSVRSPTLEADEREDGQTGDYLREGVHKVGTRRYPKQPRPKHCQEGHGVSMAADENLEMSGWLKKRNTKAKGTLVRRTSTQRSSLHLACRPWANELKPALVDIGTCAHSKRGFSTPHPCVCIG
jgi:hypothetical protein